WINCTNLFDASSGFGGYRESGFGREGGKEGLYEYVRPVWEREQARDTASDIARNDSVVEAIADDTQIPSNGSELSELEADDELDDAPTFESMELPGIDRTPKLFIVGKQTRPDSGYSRAVYDSTGYTIGE